MACESLLGHTLAALLVAAALTLPASAAEPTHTDAVQLVLAEGWSRETAVAPASVRYRHADSGASVELVTLDAGPPAADAAPGLAPDASDALDDWLVELADRDPRVSASARDRVVVDLGGDGEGARELAVELVRVTLDFDARTAIVLGFTSRSLAAARGEQLDAGRDRYAWIVLIEASAEQRDALSALQQSALDALQVEPE